jgi:hypothetical protein
MITKIERPKTGTIQSGKIPEVQFPKSYIKVTGFINRSMKHSRIRPRFRVDHVTCPRCQLLFVTAITVLRCQCKVQQKKVTS